MALENPKAHHIQYPRGVKCLDCEDFTPLEIERCLSCGSSAVALVEEGEWEGGAPHPGHPHFVEVDCSTGMVGYARLTKEEVAEQKANEKLARAAEKDAQKELDARLGVIRAKAIEDEGFAALAKHLGIPLEP
jgi:hypothetical protein